MNEALRQKVLRIQKQEVTELLICEKLHSRCKNKTNKKILKRIIDDEREHYKFWEKKTGEVVAPNLFRVFFFYWVSRLFGLTFGLKLMEKDEQNIQKDYDEVVKKVPGARRIQKEEERHETELLNMIDEKHLNYVGSIVLGLNDALVELTGALAGLTFALQNPQLIALTGSITGIAASMSMAGSEYLARKSDKSEKNPLTASIYTGIAYICTVVVLVFPYMVLDNVFASLGLTLLFAVLIILVFNFYVAIAQGESFKKRFLEMVAISMGVAALSFVIGMLARAFIGVDL